MTKFCVVTFKNDYDKFAHVGIYKYMVSGKKNHMMTLKGQHTKAKYKLKQRKKGKLVHESLFMSGFHIKLLNTGIDRWVQDKGKIFETVDKATEYRERKRQELRSERYSLSDRSYVYKPELKKADGKYSSRWYRELGDKTKKQIYNIIDQLAAGGVIVEPNVKNRIYFRYIKGEIKYRYEIFEEINKFNDGRNQ